MSTYKIIEGKKMDTRIIDQASLLVQGIGDGRISVENAKLLFTLVIDGSVITNVEKDTLDYIFKHFRWTASATEWFKRELKAWQTRKTPTRITLGDLSQKHFSAEDVLQDSPAKAARIHALQAATTETIRIMMKLDFGSGLAMELQLKCYLILLNLKVILFN